MFCKNCGKELPESAKFCSNCGTPVASGTPTQPQDRPADRESPVILAEPEIPAEENASPEPVEAESPVILAEPEVPAEESASPEPVEAGSPVILMEPEAPAEENASTEPVEAGTAVILMEPEAPAEESVPSGPVEAGPTVPEYPAAADEPGASPVKRRGKTGLVVIGAVAVVVIALLVVAVKAVVGLLGGGGAAVYAYLNDDGELMYLADLKEKTTALELTDEANIYDTEVSFSPDGKTVYFTDEDGVLYRVTAAELKKGGKPERISRDVLSFRVLKDGRVLFTKSGPVLNVYENGDSYRLIKDYDSYSNVLSEDEKALYYTEHDDSDGTYSLYKISVAKDAKAERLLKGATAIYSDYDAEILVYGVDDDPNGAYAAPADSSADRNTLTVYSCAPGGDRTKLVDDVYSVAGVQSEGGKVSFYYWVEDMEEHTLYDFVTDTKASADAVTLGGERPEDPSGHWNDYHVKDIMARDDYSVNTLGVVYYITYSGKETDLDVSGLVRDKGITSTEELYDYGDEIWDLAEAEVDRLYDEAYEDYSARYEAWSEAQDRDSIRQDLKETPYNQSSLSLYHYTGSGKGEAIATGVKNIGRASSAADGVFLYHKTDVESGKVVDLSDLSYSFEIYDYLTGGSGGEEDWYQNVGGKESEIDLDGVTTIYGVYVLNGKEVVLDVHDGDEESVRAYSLGKDGLTFSADIVEGDDFSGPYQGESSGKDVLYLFTDTAVENSRTMGDFCAYSGGKLETVAREVYWALILDDSGATYAVTDVDSRNETVELSLVKDGKTTAVNDELNGMPIFVDDTQLLYINDGDLVLWNGKENRTVARDVEYVWASARESYSVYYP